MRWRMKRVTWFALFLVMVVSCLDQPDCYRQNLNLIGISFKKLRDGKPDTVVLYKVFGDNSYPFFNDTVGTTNIAIPLNYLSESMTLSLKGILKDDVLKLGFTSKAQFVSEECGTRFIISDLKILDKTLTNHDSVRVTSSLPANPAGTNIVIYRCPRTNIMRLSFRQLLMNDDSIGQLDPRLIKTITTDSGPAEKYSATPKYSSLATSSVLLALNPKAKAITYQIQFDNEKRTVGFKYEMGTKEIVKSCDIQNVFGRLDTTSTDFKILKVVNDSIYDPPHTNVISYRCPTTNEIGILFREKKGDSKPASVKITSITADYVVDLSAYANKTVSSLVLPLNPASSAQSTTFTFVIGGQNKSLVIKYVAEEKRFHKSCGFTTVFSALNTVQKTGFTEQTILDVNVKFPAVNNVEIIP